jgi:hypothetical protein
MQSIVNGRVGGTLSSFCFCIALALVPLPAAALPLLSEVFYDAAGSDDGLGFVELHGEPGTSLVGFTIEGVNGANGAVTHTLVLAGVIPADGIFVLADAAGDGASLVTDADLVLNFDFQNGPDCIVLRDSAAVIDAIGSASSARARSSWVKARPPRTQRRERVWHGASRTWIQTTTRRIGSCSRYRLRASRPCRRFPSRPRLHWSRRASSGSRASSAPGAPESESLPPAAASHPSSAAARSPGE